MEKTTKQNIITLNREQFVNYINKYKDYDYEDYIKEIKDYPIEGKETVYTELHHIVPRCMGGPDNKDNLIKLIPVEHYTAHMLLAKEYPDIDGIQYAWCCMNAMWNDNGDGQKKLPLTVEDYSKTREKIGQSSSERLSVNFKCIETGEIFKSLAEAKTIYPTISIKEQVIKNIPYELDNKIYTFKFLKAEDRDKYLENNYYCKSLVIFDKTLTTGTDPKKQINGYRIFADWTLAGKFLNITKQELLDLFINKTGEYIYVNEKQYKIYFLNMWKTSQRIIPDDAIFIIENGMIFYNQNKCIEYIKNGCDIQKSHHSLKLSLERGYMYQNKKNKYPYHICLFKELFNKYNLKQSNLYEIQSDYLRYLNGKFSLENVRKKYVKKKKLKSKAKDKYVRLHGIVTELNNMSSSINDEDVAKQILEISNKLNEIYEQIAKIDNKSNNTTKKNI